jgi:hypothetical protein
VFRTTLLLKTKQGDVMMQWGSGDLGRVAGPVWTFVETNRDGDADMEHIYQAGRPALTKQIASKNTHWFGQGKTSTAFKMVKARKEELNSAVPM